MIKNLLDDDDRPGSEPPEAIRETGSGLLGLGSFEEEEAKRKEEPFVLSDAPPETFAETARKSGLAWSAGIAFFASVVFMLVIGWIIDVLLGASPWGIVAGIILGSLIGFFQFFRITSQIFKK